MRFAVLVAGLFVIGQTGRPGTECDDTAPAEGLTVDLVAEGGYADGGYEVVAIADGVALRGSFAVAGGNATCALGAEGTVVVFAGQRTGERGVPGSAAGGR